MYAGRVACCSPVSHVKHAPRALLRLEKRDRQTDRRQTVTLRSNSKKMEQAKGLVSHNGLFLSHEPLMAKIATTLG